MVAGHGAESTVLPGTPDPNPIVDQGCPRSVGGLESAKTLCRYLGIRFKLEPLDCDPFLHGYGETCSDARVTICIWKLPFRDKRRTEVSIRFYIVPGDGIILFGNEVCSKSDILGTKNVIKVPKGIVSEQEAVLPTYTESVGSSERSGKRTYLAVVPSKLEFFAVHFASQSFTTTQTPIRDRLSTRHAARKFAVKLHTYSHLTSEDMRKLCERAGVYSRILDEELKRAVEKCSSCKGTGRPLNNRPISLRKILSTFNTHLQLDFFYITEMGQAPILHLVDVGTGLSATSLVPSRDIDVAAKTIEKIWFNIHGPPAKLSGDPEFVNGKFSELMKRFSVTVEPRPARRHQKIGVVERKHAVVRTLAQRILKDVEFVENAVHGNAMDCDEPDLNAHILSRATFVSNVLYGSRKVSSFNLSRGYTPAIGGLPQTKVEEDLIRAYQEQTARRALMSVDCARTPKTLEKEQLKRDTPVY